MSSKPIFPQEQVVGSDPIGQGSHVVREGECMSSLAAQKGLFVAQIFEHPANAQLSTVRGDPNILLPGDRVTIPQFARKDVDRSTEQRNKFVLLGEPVFLRRSAPTTSAKIFPPPSGSASSCALRPSMARRIPSG